MSGAVSIQRRVLALVGIGVFIAAAVLSLVSRSSLLALEQEVRADQERLAAALAGTVSRLLDDDLRLLATVATAPRVDPGDGVDAPERAALDGAILHGRLWSALALVDATGSSASVVPPADRALFDSPAVRTLASQSLATQRPAVSDLIATSEGPCIAGVVPLRATDGLPAGAVVGLARIAGRRSAALLPAAAGTLVEIRDGRGEVIAGTARTGIPALPIAAPMAVAGTGWTLQAWTDGPDPLAPIAIFRRRSIWLAPVLSAVAMLLGWGIARSVRGPLGTLTASAERIAQGDLAHAIDTSQSASAGDEVARLAAALESMRAALKRSMDRIEDANRLLERRVEDRTRDLHAANLRLQDRERARQDLLRKVISAQEDERRRVARELHDETSQALAAIGIGVDTASATSPDPETRHRLADLRRLVDRMHHGLNRLIVNLRPSVLDDLGLAAAIAWLAPRQFDPSRTMVRCELDDLEDLRLSAEFEIAIFRAVQEAITNVARHANADTVLIQGCLTNAGIRIEVEDDGEGFVVEEARESPGSMRGVGLLGMRERLEILGGTLRIESEPGRGTHVVMDVPLAPAARAAGVGG